MRAQLGAILHYERGQWLMFSHRVELAKRAYQRVIYWQEKHLEAWYQLGLIHEKQFNFFLSLEAFSKCLQIRPDRVTPRLYLRLARSFDHLKLEQSALPLYLKALEDEQVEPSVYFYLAQALDKMGDLDAAMDSLISVGKQHPTKLDLVSFLMGYLLERRGFYELARQCFEEAVAHNPRQLLWQLKRDLTYPVVMKSASQIERFRIQMEQALERFLKRLEHQPVRLPRSVFFMFSVLHTNTAYVAYHHGCVLSLRRLMASLARRTLIPPEVFVAPPPRKRFHLGILVASKSISLGYVYAGALAAQLDPEDFEVTLFCTSPDVALLFKSDRRYHFTSQQKHVHWKLITQDPYAAARQIRQSRLDAMFFTEPAWDFQQYALALFRVAPAQFTSWMNPGTTGLQSMDYFYSSALMEHADGQKNYTETLVAGPEFPSYVPSFTFPEPVGRDHFGLQEDWHVYGCLQNMLKLHPDFDDYIADILRADPLGHLVLVSAKNQKIAEEITRRFQHAMPDLMPRIWVFPELSNQDFLHLLQTTDVILDPLHYGGGTTTYQALAWGAALVTQPTSQMVGQITAGLCRAMAYEEAIVPDKKAYVKRALFLAQSPREHLRIQQHLRAQRDRIFENPAAVTQFASFLKSTRKRQTAAD